MSELPQRPAHQSVIDACALLDPLSDAQRKRLASESTMASSERGELLWLAGAPAESVAVIGTGFVKMTKNSPHGSDIALELLGPGHSMGILAAIEGRPLPLSATAVTHTWYLKIPARAILEVYRENSAFKDQVVRSIAPRLRKAHDMMSRLSSGRVEERMAAVLTILTASYGERRPRGVRLTVPLTRQDLAEMAGTTVETAIRVMSRWQKDGIIATNQHIITILREDALGEALR